MEIIKIKKLGERHLRCAACNARFRVTSDINHDRGHYRRHGGLRNVAFVMDHPVYGINDILCRPDINLHRRDGCGCEARNG